MRARAGKILQVLKHRDGYQLISVGLNLYYIKQGEVVESVLDSSDSVLSESDIDRILALSHQNGSHSKLDFILAENQITLEKISPPELDELYHMTPPPAIKEKWPLVLRGIPCSQGFAMGETLPLQALRLNLNLTGKILVANQLPLNLFENLNDLKGIILGSGSILSHVGVLAREQKIACIMGVKNYHLIPEGARIRMDATTGLISPAP